MRNGDSFGPWLKQRRKALDLTQEALARRVGCATVTIHKIEADGLRPSRQMAEQLAKALEIPAIDIAWVLHAARSGVAGENLGTGGCAATAASAATPSAPAPFPATSTLPSPTTVFIGREQAVADASSLLRRPDVRLVTLTGPGGIGKTRLALQVAAEAMHAYADGVWFVDLAPLRDPGLVLSVIAQVLGLKESKGQSLGESLKASLIAKQTLLLLDNFEHMLDAAIHVADLLQVAPGLNVLATSRAPLHLSSEHQYLVPPLALPNLHDANIVKQVVESAASALFVAGAQAVRHDFVVTPANAATIAALCTRLDGLPLAIELAAARTKVLSPEPLLQALEQRLPLLTGGSRDLPVRHQTIRAAISWSYELLDDAEQTLLRRLGVFVGGWTLVAAEIVCRDVKADLASTSPPRAPSLAILDGVQVLLEQSLLQVVEHDVMDGTAELRYGMLELVREYAFEQLVEAGEAPMLQRRHASYFLHLAEMAGRELEQSSEPVAWFERLEQEHDNLRVALQWALDAHEDTLALRMGTALRWFWVRRGHLSEGRRWLEAALASATNNAAVPPGLRAEALLTTAWIAKSQGDYRRAEALFMESLALFEALGDQAGTAGALDGSAWTAWDQSDFPRAAALAERQLRLERERGNQPGIARALVVLGWIAHDRGDFEQAFTLLEESLTHQRALDDRGGVALALYALGVTAYLQGDFERAACWLGESLPMYQGLGDIGGIAHVLAHLGDIATYQGDIEGAGRLLDEALALRRRLEDTSSIAVPLRFQSKLALVGGDWARATRLLHESLALMQGTGGYWEIAACLEGLAGVAEGQGQSVRAARLWGAAALLREAIGAPLSPADRGTYEAAVARTQVALGGEACEVAWAEGRAMTLEQAIAYARNEMPDA